jgi:hypothetical protein
VYIDRRLREGRVNSLAGIIAAHREGTVQRVRPKLMTVATMLFGLVPLLWAQGSGADVMKRIAAPMVGGLLTSAFLTLEIIPVIYTYWRNEQLLWRQLERVSDRLLRRLRVATAVLKGAGLMATAALVTRLYVATPPRAVLAMPMVATGFALLALVVHLFSRVEARRSTLHRQLDESDN